MQSIILQNDILLDPSYLVLPEEGELRWFIKQMRAPCKSLRGSLGRIMECYTSVGEVLVKWQALEKALEYKIQSLILTSTKVMIWAW